MATGGKFEAGRSGNPAGKARGTRNRTTLAMEAILDGEAEALTRKAIELALDGDGPALRLCLDRLCPPRKDRTISFPLPAIETATDLTRATSALLQGVADGEITPGEAAELSKLVDAHVKAIEAVDLAARIATLEQAAGGEAMKLTDRLDRLERMDPQGGQEGMTREVARAWLRAIAIALGGYPHPPLPASSYAKDTLGDGVARGLGYADRETMDAQAMADPEDWRRRIERSHAALRERYRADAYPEPTTRAHHHMCSALDEWAGAKAGNPNWPENEDDACLARALAFYGVGPEACIAETRQ